MIIHVICQICGETLSKIEKESPSQEDLDMYVQSSSCNENGQEKIIAVITKD